MLTYFYPSKLDLEEITKTEGNIDAKHEFCLTRIATNKKKPTQFSCCAKEICMGDGPAIGYGLYVRQPGKLYYPIAPSNKEEEAKIAAKQNAHLIEWMYHLDKSVYVRVNSKTRVQSLMDSERVTQKDNPQQSVKLASQFTKGSFKKETGNAQEQESDKEESEDDTKPMAETFYGKIAMKIGRKWDKPVIAFLLM